MSITPLIHPFDGCAETAIDDKNRLVIPLKARKILGGFCVLAVNNLNALCIYPEQQWLEKNIELSSFNRNNPTWDDLTRLVYGNSLTGVSIDVQGRVTVPQVMINKARLFGKVRFIGAYDRCEVWNLEEHIKYEGDPYEFESKRRAIFAKIWKEAKGESTLPEEGE